MRKILGACLCCCIIAARAQVNDRLELPDAKFKTGDDKSWSDPSFKDEAWSTIKTNSIWESQGYDGYNGYAWYRIHFVLPSSIKNNAFWKDSLRIFMAKIDDADEVFLNGTMIAKDGSFPTDEKGYITRWNDWREYHLATTNPLLKWDKDNLVAIKVYDGGGAGGLFAATPYVNMLDIIDGIKMKIDLGDGKEKKTRLFVQNIFGLPVSGTVNIKVFDPEKNKIIQSTSSPVRLKPDSSFISLIKILPNQRLQLKAEFIEKNTGKSISVTKLTPYILTPKPSGLPKINGASVFGVRPHSPFLFKIAATGQKPLSFAVVALPAGLRVDPSTGIINGALDRAGEYKMQFVVKNKTGVARKEFIVKCGDLLALTPPMGWNSWNCWGLSVSDEKLRSSAQALIDKGLADHGWTYMNIDDGWEAAHRNDGGEIVANNKFPDMRSLGNWLHSKGLKFGIYSSPGPMTCGSYLGTYQHEMQDAVSYSNWGIDYLKYDWCSYGNIHGGKDSTVSSYKKPYEVMQRALRGQSRDILYSLCQYGMKNVWQWGKDVDGNCWRTTGDIEDTWESLSNIGFNQYKISSFAQPGRWNDPDMLIVGQVGWGETLHPTRLTPDEQYTHISLWCLLSAPLLIGCDISKMDDFTVCLLTNDEVLALDQDPLGKEATRAITTDGYQVWIKELEDGNKALGIFNLKDEFQSVRVDWKELKLGDRFKVRDLWRQKDLGIFSSFVSNVAPHGVTLVKISK